MSTGEVDYRLSGVQAWPTLFFRRLWRNYSEENASIVRLLYELKSSQSVPIESGIAIGSKPANGLHEGNFDLFRHPNPSLQKLVRFIADSISLAVHIANEKEYPASALDVRFVDSWYHITNGGDFHDAHHHHHSCSRCGIYYAIAGSSGSRSGGSAPNGGSRFYSPLMIGGAYRDVGNRYLAESLDPPIENGLLLLFPSYLLHSGLPYQGQEDRVVIAFNAQVFLRTQLPDSSGFDIQQR